MILGLGCPGLQPALTSHNATISPLDWERLFPPDKKFEGNRGVAIIQILPSHSGSLCPTMTEALWRDEPAPRGYARPLGVFEKRAINYSCISTLIDTAALAGEFLALIRKRQSRLAGLSGRP